MIILTPTLFDFKTHLNGMMIDDIVLTVQVVWVYRTRGLESPTPTYPTRFSSSSLN